MMKLPDWAPAALYPVFQMYDDPRHCHVWPEVRALTLDDRLAGFWSTASQHASSPELTELKILLLNAGGPIPSETCAERKKRRREIAGLIRQLRRSLARERMASSYVKDSSLCQLQELLETDELPLSILWIDQDNLPSHVNRETARQTYLARRLKAWFRGHVGRPCHDEVSTALQVRCGECDIDVAKA